MVSDPILFLLAANVVLLIAGALLESVALLILATPILAPMAVSMGVDPIHFGIVVIVNAMIGVGDASIRAASVRRQLY